MDLSRSCNIVGHSFLSVIMLLKFRGVLAVEPDVDRRKPVIDVPKTSERIIPIAALLAAADASELPAAPGAARYCGLPRLSVSVQW
jgi:hypothetical protein